MKRSYFVDNVTTWWELQDFCSDERCDICDEIIDSCGYDDYINEKLVDLAGDYSWTELRDILNEYYDNSGYEYYAYSDYNGEYVGVDDLDFERYKSEVLDWADESEVWEPEDDEEPESEYEAPEKVKPEVDPEDLEPVPEEDCSFADMFSAGLGCVMSINDEALRRAQELEQDFLEFI